MALRRHPGLAPERRSGRTSPPLHIGVGAPSAPHAIPSIDLRKLLPALAFGLLVAGLPQVATAVDSRTERALRIRDEILLKRRDQAAHQEDPFAAAVTAARERVAAIDAQIEERRRRSEGMAAPREKLAARGDELAAKVSKLQEENRARVEAIYRSAKLGAGAAGWHGEPARSARLSRYLAAIATVQQARVDVVEVEHGSVIAALDRARADDAAAAAELRVLEADRAEADARLAHALTESGSLEAAGAAPDPDVPLEAGSSDPGAAAAPGIDAAPPEVTDSARAIELAMARLAARTAQQPSAAEPEGDDGSGAPPAGDIGRVGTPAGEGGAFKWPGTAGAAEVAAVPAAPPVPAVAPPKPDEPPVRPTVPVEADEHGELEDGPAVLAPSSATAALSATPSGEAASGAPDPGADAQAAPPGDAPETNPPARRGFISRIFGNDRDADNFAAARGKLPPPVAGKVVANYGQQHKSGATYRGVILRAGHSAPIKSVAEGQVSFAGTVPGLGNTVIVSHGGRYHTVYARLGAIRVKEGESVHGGSEIGELPEDNADMHFELRDQGKAVDPIPWLRGVPGAAP